MQITNAPNSEGICLTCFSRIDNTIAILQILIKPLEVPSSLLLRRIVKWNDERSKVLGVAILDEQSETKSEHFINDEVGVRLVSVVASFNTTLLLEFLESLTEGDDDVSRRSEGELSRFLKGVILHRDIEGETSRLTTAAFEEVSLREAVTESRDSLDALVGGGDEDVADLVSCDGDTSEAGHGIDDDDSFRVVAADDGGHLLDGVDDASTRFRVNSDERAKILNLLDGVFEVLEIQSSSLRKFIGVSVNSETTTDVGVANAVGTIADDESLGFGIFRCYGGDGTFNSHRATARHGNSSPVLSNISVFDTSDVDNSRADFCDGFHEEGIAGTVIGEHGFFDRGSGQEGTGSEEKFLIRKAEK